MAANQSPAPSSFPPEGPTHHAFPPSPAGQTLARADGRGYIDDNTLAKATASPASCPPSSDAGSSVEEETDDQLSGGKERGGGPVWDELDEASLLAGLPLHTAGPDSPTETEDGGEWDVENEDWDLANGDFTKQYNRARQQRAALSANHASGSLSPGLCRIPSRPPLPAANQHKIVSHPASGPSRPRRHLTHPAVFSSGVIINPKSALDRHEKDKADRATQEQVLDERTRLVLFGLVKRRIIGSLKSCISTGKEANVYSASIAVDTPIKLAPLPSSLAVKVYRTSILNFRSRQAYIVGEHRFRGEYSASKNARKMVRVWAEKELRNLRRLEQGGIRSPRAIECRENVLVMEYLGSEQHASPRLKDADLSPAQLSELYPELLVAMRRMYHHCKLVHADLSEYNILYHDSHLYIIDVSQSVEHDHPRTFDFLRKDIQNMDDFFLRRSVGEVHTLGLRRTFEFITSDHVDGLKREDEIGVKGEHRLRLVVEHWLLHTPISGETPTSSNTAVPDLTSPQNAKTDDAVFMSSYIPRHLSEVYDPERDIDILKSGQPSSLLYADLAGLHIEERKPSGSSQNGDIASHDEPRGKSVRFEDEDNEPDESGTDQTDDELGETKRGSRGVKHESREEKKDRKKAVKEENRERRKHKMPKAEKQKLLKKAVKR